VKCGFAIRVSSIVAFVTPISLSKVFILAFVTIPISRQAEVHLSIRKVFNAVTLAVHFNETLEVVQSQCCRFRRRIFYIGVSISNVHLVW